MALTRSKPVTLFIIRHGERVDHVDPTWSSTASFPLDPPLTSHGHQQAIQTGQHLHSYLSEKMWSASEASQSIFMFSSPFLRCLQTSQNILTGMGQLGSCIDIRPDISLCEWLSPDYFQDQLTHDNLQYFSETRTGSDESHPLPSYPEAYPDMLNRSQSLIKKIDSWSQSLTNVKSPIVILVTHGAVVNGLLESCLKSPFLTIVDTCSISCVKKQFTGAWQPAMLASSRHLKV